MYVYITLIVIYPVRDLCFRVVMKSFVLQDWFSNRVYATG